MTPLLVELVGPPGVGKSTVFARLLEREPRAEPMPILRRRRGTAVLLSAHLAYVAAMVAVRRAARREVSYEGLVLMAYLTALPPVLRRRPAGRVVVFDQGPIYTLMRPLSRDPRLAPWARRRQHRWRELLDVVVWLDAPEAVLVERINAREKEHRFKGLGPQAALELVGEDRALYAAAVERMASGPGAPVLVRVDTSRRSPDEAVDQILAALETR